MQCKTGHPKINNSIIFSVFKILCNSDFYLGLKYFHHLKKGCTLQAVVLTPHFHVQAPGISTLSLWTYNSRNITEVPPYKIRSLCLPSSI